MQLGPLRAASLGAGQLGGWGRLHVPAAPPSPWLEAPPAPSAFCVLWGALGACVVGLGSEEWAAVPSLFSDFHAINPRNCVRSD